MSCPPRIDNEVSGQAAAFRAHFPCLARVAHLASCSQGPLSARVTDAVYHYLGSVNRDGAAWETWLAENGIPLEERHEWERGGVSLYFRDPDRHLLEVVTPGVWTIY